MVCLRMVRPPIIQSGRTKVLILHELLGSSHTMEARAHGLRMVRPPKIQNSRRGNKKTPHGLRMARHVRRGAKTVHINGPLEGKRAGYVSHAPLKAIIIKIYLDEKEDEAEKD